MNDNIARTDVRDLTIVLDMGADGRWAEILTQEDANQASYLTRTAIQAFYSTEEKREGGHPRRWFVFIDDGFAPVGKVCLAVTPDGVELSDHTLIPFGTHTTGNFNTNPYPDYARQIEALSQAIGIEIPPNCMGRPIEPAPSGLKM